MTIRALRLSQMVAALGFLFALAAMPAAAETEVHLVGVYEGSAAGRAQARPAVQDVRVVVDRPDADVILFLGSYDPIFWQVDTGPATRIARIILHGHGIDSSGIAVNGKPYAEVIRTHDLPYAYKSQGQPFRTLVARARDYSGTDRIDSFTGAYRAPPEGFTLRTSELGNPLFSDDYLSGFVKDMSIVPPSLRQWLDPGHDSPNLKVTFDYSGMTVADGNSTTVFPAPEKPASRCEWLRAVPKLFDRCIRRHANHPAEIEISHPVAADRDPETGHLYGVTLGGDGLLLRVDGETDEWTVLRSMDGLDADGLLFDPGSRRILIPGGDPFHRSHQILIVELDGRTRVVDLRGAAFYGLTDLYDVGNGRPPRLVPVAADGDMLVLQTADHRQIKGASSGPSRTYLVDLRSGSVDLVAYDD